MPNWECSVGWGKGNFGKGWWGRQAQQVVGRGAQTKLVVGSMVGILNLGVMYRV